MPSLSILSYTIACAAFGALAVLAWISDRRILQGRALCVAASVSCLWALLFVNLEAGKPIPYWLVLIAELARSAAWLHFLLLLAPSRWVRTGRWLIPGLLVAWAAVGGLFMDPNRVLTRGGLVAALLGLVVLEQIFRNAPAEARANLKFFVLGTGGLFAFDLFLFSQAELFRGFDADSWHSRGIVDALLVPFLIVGARRLPNVKFELFVSRQVTLYSTAFLVLGIYVLVTAGAGLLIRRFGGQWGEIVRLVFLAGAIVVLVVLIGSDAIRRRLRVFLSKHFYRTKYDYRAEWLRFIRTLSAASPEDVLAAAVRSVAQILDSPGGYLYRQPEGTTAFVPVAVWPVSYGNLTDMGSIPANSELIGFMQSKRWIIDLREREVRPALYENADVPIWLQSDPRWRLLSPIFLGDVLLGFFILLEPPAPFRLMFEDRDLLNTSGQHVATLLAQQDADRRIAELRQFQAYNQLTTFVMHDLKNCAAQLSLLVGNAAKHRHNPEFVDDAIATIAQTSERMTRMIAQLRTATVDSHTESIDLKQALRTAVNRCAPRQPQPVLELGVEHPCRVSADPERLAAALEHVIRNAQEAAGQTGTVHVSLDSLKGRARVLVADTGTGMDAEFIRSRLFRPFDTTKGPHGMGIGAYQARELVRSVGGTVEVSSSPGRGTSFVLEFPSAPLAYVK